MRWFPRTSLQSLEHVEQQMVGLKYRLVEEFQTEGQFTVSLWQSKADGFAVTYGLQVALNLPFVDACTELGECLLHALTCAGKVRQ